MKPYLNNDLKRLNKILFIISNNRSPFCSKCRNELFYLNMDYVKICQKCKNKFSLFKDTIFENVRFGKLKAINIAIEYYYSKFSLSSIYVSKKYSVTQKTAYLFLTKLRNNKIELKSFIDYNKMSNKDIDGICKLISNLIKTKVLF